MRKDWIECNLYETCVKASKVSRNEVTLTEEIKYIDIGGIDNQENKIISHKIFEWKNAPSRAQQIIKFEDILFSTVRTYLRNIAKVTSEVYDNEICSSGFTVLRANKNILISNYLFFFSLSSGFLNSLSKLQTGTSYPAVRDKDVFSQNIPLPPLPEQRAIVAKIEELFTDLDKGIADLKKAQAQLVVYRQAVLKKAFEGELTKEWRELKNTSKVKWKSVKLGNVLIQSKEKHKPDKVENLFYVGLEHIQKETGCLTESVGFEEIKTVKNKFYRGQVLYGKLRPYLNKVYLAKESGVCSTDILVFNLKDEVIGMFALKYMLSRTFVNDMSANTNGVNLPRVSTKYINSYTFPLPTVLEQHQIVKEIESRLSVCDQMEKSIVESIEKSKALRQSILKKAFEGSLLSEAEIAACKKEKDYEPAGVLLGRIRGERKK